MSDTERLNLRDLPPVDEAVQLPQRFSQTLLGHANSCKRAAYLYLLRGGGTPAVELAFGTAAHAVFERILLDLMAAGEKSLYAPAEGEDPEAAARQVASLTAAIVDEVLRERDDLTIPVAHPTHSIDHLREQAYHFAIASDIDPEAILGVEQKFVLELPSGLVVSAKLDVAEDLGIAHDGLAGITDWKSSFAALSEGEFVEKFQGLLYAIMLCFGTPLDENGEPLPTFGDHIRWVRVREAYPRLAPIDGELRQVRAVYSRQALSDRLPDIDLLATDLVERIESGKFPATPGSWCTNCPSSPECPLPAVLRRHAGEINDMSQAAEAASWWDRAKAEVAATQKELRAFARAHGPIRYGRDKVLEFSPTESFETDWPGLEVAVAESVSFGVPFDLNLHRKRRISNRFSDRKLTPAELGPGESEEVLDGDERWGADAPF